MHSGAELGKYRIVRRIGQGGMADVYEAEDTELGRKVALKLLPPELARDPERVARFMKEVRNSAALQHPNIIPIYDVGEGDGFHFYTMQLLLGGDLKDRIKAGMPPADAMAVLRQVASALGAAHARGVVHRDVKPENVMFDGEGRAVLTDLGIARAATGGTRMTKTGMSIGTPHYMSPEQACGKAVDGRSDIYSLGVVLHEMLTGKVPYDAEESFAVGYMHINDPIPMLPSGLSAYQPMLGAMLAKKPEHRYPDCAALVRDVERVERGEVAQGAASADAGVARPARRDEVSDSSRRGGGVKAAAIGALAALLVVGGVFWFFNRDGSSSAAARGGFVSASGGSASVHEPRPRAARPSPDEESSVGVLELSSEPVGAAVFLDGRRKGKTPVTLRDVRAGAHEVELRLDKHDVERLSVGVKKGKSVSRHVLMSYSRELMRSLTVKADPSDSIVKILNIKPKYKPGILLSPGKYKVQVAKDGFVTKEVWVDVTEKDVVLPVSLDVAESEERRNFKEDWRRAVKNSKSIESKRDDEMKRKEMLKIWRAK